MYECPVTDKTEREEGKRERGREEERGREGEREREREGEEGEKMAVSLVVENIRCAKGSAGIVRAAAERIAALEDQLNKKTPSQTPSDETGDGDGDDDNETHNEIENLNLAQRLGMVIADALREVIGKSQHIVVGNDVIAAVRIASTNRALFKISMKEIDETVGKDNNNNNSKKEKKKETTTKDGYLTVLVYQSVDGGAIPPTRADEDVVPCHPLVTDESGGDSDWDDEEEDGFIHCKPKSKAHDTKPLSVDIVSNGCYGPKAEHESVLLAVERSIMKEMQRKVDDDTNTNSQQQQTLEESSIETIAMRIRNSLSKEHGHLWHVLACKRPYDSFIVKTALSPLPDAVVNVFAAEYVWIIFRHSASQTDGLDVNKMRKEFVKSSRLVLLVFGALAVFYFQSYCGGSLMQPASEDEPGGKGRVHLSTGVQRSAQFFHLSFSMRQCNIGKIRLISMFQLTLSLCIVCSFLIDFVLLSASLSSFKKLLTMDPRRIRIYNHRSKNSRSCKEESTEEEEMIMR